MTRIKRLTPQRPRVPITATDDERLRWHGWDVTESGCWEWRGSRHRAGYGAVGRGSKIVTTHRLAYQTWVGPIPEGLMIRHKCDNPPCINPDHLEPGTSADNMRDKAIRNRSGRTLSEADVDDVLWLKSQGALQKDIAAAYGVSATLISNICRGLQRAPSDSNHRKALNHG